MKTIRKNIVLVMTWAIALPVFMMFQIAFLQNPTYAADSIEDIQDERSDIQKKLDKELAAKKKLEQNLGQIKSAVSTTQVVINKTQAAIAEAEQTISRKEGEINNLEGRIKLHEEMLRNFLQEIYYIKSQPMLGVVLAQKNFAEMFSDADHLMTLEDKIVSVSDELDKTKMQIEQDKTELAQVKEQHEEILDEKVDQKKELVADQVETQLSIADKQKAIDRLKKELKELEGDLAELMGKSYDAKDIREAVEYASGKTGVPEGVLYGFLKKETNLGANTGQCTYDQVEKVAVARYKSLLKKNKKWQASIDLLYKRKGIFEDIVKSLGYSKDKKVSCSPSGYIGQGGAMGVSQFMSDVWRGYESQIKANTGHGKPDPWNLTDGVMAMAIKLKKAGATSSSASVIKKASINYLGTFNSNYYEGIVYWSKNYKLLFQ